MRKFTGLVAATVTAMTSPPRANIVVNHIYLQPENCWPEAHSFV